MSDARALAGLLEAEAARLLELAGRVRELDQWDDADNGAAVRLLDAAEVAELLAVPKSRVYELAAAGELPAIRLGGRQLRFPQAEIAAWIRSRCST